MDDVLNQWLLLVAHRNNFAGVPITRLGKTSQSEKWRYWRCGLGDGSTISVNVQTKPGGTKSSLSVNHDKLPSSDMVESRRAFWRTFLQLLNRQE